MSKSVKRNSKATLFERLFNEKPNSLELYKSLHPEDTTVCEDDIEVITLTNTLTNSRYNDLGFLVRDKLMVLVEAQSTWSNAITLRMLLYLADSYGRWINDNKISTFDDNKLEIPSPELYVIYYKDDNKGKDVIRLSDVFFGGKNKFVEVKAQVIRYVEGSNTILNQYIRFCQIFDAQVSTYGREGTKAIEETIRICLQEGILVSFLKGREEELMDIRDILFNQEWENEVMRYNAEKKGIAIGEENAAKRMALKLLKAGISPSIVSQCSGLTLEQLAALAK